MMSCLGYNFTIEHEYKLVARFVLRLDDFAFLVGQEMETHLFNDAGKIVFVQSLEKGKLQQVIVHSCFRYVFNIR